MFRNPFNMNFCVAVSVLVGMTMGVPVHAASSPAALEFTAEQEMPAEVYQGDRERLHFTVRNVADHSITIDRIFPRKGGGSGSATPGTLAPGSVGKIELDLTFPEALGAGQVNFLVKTNNPDKPTEMLGVSYFVQSAFSPELRLFDFGNLHTGQRARSTLEVSTRLVPELKLEKVISKPDWLDVEIKPSASGSGQSKRVVATTTSLPPVGIVNSEVVLKSNLDRDRPLRIPVLLRAFSKYAIAPLPLSLGGVDEGMDKHSKLRITRFGKGDVLIDSVETGSPALRAERVSCGSGCVDLMLTFDSMKARGGLQTVLKVSFKDDTQPLLVPIDALVVPIGVKSIELGDLDTLTVRGKTEMLEPSP